MDFAASVLQRKIWPYPSKETRNPVNDIFQFNNNNIWNYIRVNMGCGSSSEFEGEGKRKQSIFRHKKVSIQVGPSVAIDMNHRPRLIFVFGRHDNFIYLQIFCIDIYM